MCLAPPCLCFCSPLEAERLAGPSVPAQAESTWYQTSETGNALVSGFAAFPLVECCDVVGQCSRAALGWGVLVDYDPPRIGQVYDGFTRFDDVRFQSITDVFFVNWVGWDDAGAGIAYFETALTTADDCVADKDASLVMPWRNHTARTTIAQWSGLSGVLTTGIMYHACVRAVDQIGNNATATSNGTATSKHHLF